MPIFNCVCPARDREGGGEEREREKREGDWGGGVLSSHGSSCGFAACRERSQIRSRFALFALDRVNKLITLCGMGGIIEFLFSRCSNCCLMLLLLLPLQRQLLQAAWARVGALIRQRPSCCCFCCRVAVARKLTFKGDWPGSWPKQQTSRPAGSLSGLFWPKQPERFSLLAFKLAN